MDFLVDQVAWVVSFQKPGLKFIEAEFQSFFIGNETDQFFGKAVGDVVFHVLRMVAVVVQVEV